MKQRKLIRGCQAHINAGLGCGADYVASTGTPLYAPFDGEITTYWGSQGGNWSRLTRINGDRIEMAHLDRYVVRSGKVRSGDLIAYTGNTGAITTGPHKHIQIIRDGKRLDPERYNWEESVIIPPMTCEQELAQERSDHAETILREQLNYNNWQTELDSRQALEMKLIKEKSNHGESIAEKIKNAAERDAALDNLRQIKKIVG